jgi:hypothetical protein
VLATFKGQQEATEVRKPQGAKPQGAKPGIRPGSHSAMKSAECRCTVQKRRRVNEELWSVRRLNRDPGGVRAGEAGDTTWRALIGPGGEMTRSGSEDNPAEVRKSEL